MKFTTECICNNTHTGSECDIECSDGCNNVGICFLNNDDEAICDCNDGYFGDSCNLECPKVDGNVCNNHGICKENTSNNTVYCDCNDGYYGDTCDILCPGLEPSLLNTNPKICTGNGECQFNGTHTSCYCDDEYIGTDCSIALEGEPEATISAAYSIKIFFYWGLNNVDMSKVDETDPSSVGIPIYETTFNLSDPNAQLRIHEFCNTLTTYKRDKIRHETLSCIMTDFATYVGEKNFPVEAHLFDETMANYLSKYKTHWSNIGFENGKVVWISIHGKTFVKENQSGTNLEPEYQYWEDFMTDFNSKSPSTCNKAYQHAEVWKRMIVELAFIEGTAVSLGVALISAFASIFIFTANIYLSIMATTIMISIIISMLGFFVLMDWSLGAVEAVSLSIVVGLSVDYALHLGHAYITSPHDDRNKRASAAVREMGSSVLAASLTTIGSMVVLVLCTVHTFFVIGTIVAMTVLFAIVFSLGTFIAMLSSFGPQYENGNVTHIIRKYLCCCFFKKHNEKQLKLPENIEMDHLYK